MSASLLRTFTHTIYRSKWHSMKQMRYLATRSNEFLSHAKAAHKQEVADPKELIGADKLANVFDNELNRGDVVPVFKRSLLHANRVAIKDGSGEYSYRQILEAAKHLAADILAQTSGQERKIAFLSSNNAIYTVIQWAIWISGQIAVPLSARHPPELIRYFVEDSDADIIITTPEHELKIKSVADILKCKVIYVDQTKLSDANANQHQPSDAAELVGTFLPGAYYRDSNAMILYTSGSTGRPKGAVISHKNIQSQTDCLAKIWCINENDSVLHVLPLNHVHGSVNALLCPLSVGAKVVMHSQFDPTAVWSKLLNNNAPTKDRISVFMAVPTIYSLLIAEYEHAFSKNDRMVEYVRSQCEKIVRLMVSGSAPLPTNVFSKWEQITGHKLLERYGMTEIGMVLSNPYYIDETRKRISGTVGAVLPETTVRLMDDKRIICEVKGEHNKGFWQPSKSAQSKPNKPESETSSEIEWETNTDTELSRTIGELYVKGPSVFVEYYKKPEETKNAFEADWFKTGDVAEYKNGIFKILGRTNVDIIKTGAFKVSALEIETHLLEHPSIVDVCVVGVPDPTFGQKIAALIVSKDDIQATADSLSPAKLRAWCDERIASYQIPSLIKIINEIPRNAMGKVNKKEIVRDFFSTETQE